MEKDQESAHPCRRVTSPLVPPLGDKSRIEGLQAQVDDLKYTLSNILQCLVKTVDISRDERHAALVDDARAALEADVPDYLG